MRIGFLGDICLSTEDLNHTSHEEVLDSFSDSDILTELNKNDLIIGNLECPVTDAATGILKTGPVLRGSKYIFNILKKLNVGMVTLDNNHINDFGQQGIRETKERCAEHDIVSVGPATCDSTDNNTYIIDGDKKTGIISLAENEFNTIDFENKLDRLCDEYNTITQIIQLRKKVDYLILISHGGNEYYQYPNPYTRKKYRAFAELGVDVVIGHHPHCIQGMEKYKNTLIFYSLGNFFFPHVSDNPLTRVGYSVVLDLHEKEKSIKYVVIPYDQCNSSFKVDLLKGEQKSGFEKDFNELSEAIKDDQMVVGEWRKYLKLYNNFLVKSAYPIDMRIYYVLKKLRLLNLFFPKKKMVLLLNLMRCESHRKNFTQALISHLYK